MSAQKLNYTKMQTGTIMIENFTSMDDVTIALGVATLAPKSLEEDSEKLKEELSKSQPDQEKVNELSERIQSWEEAAKRNKIGQEESLGISLEYLIDEQKKLTIVGKTVDGNVLFEFGKGHNQVLFLYDYDDDNPVFCAFKGTFYICIYDQGNGGMVGVVEQSENCATIYMGDVKHDQYIEFVDFNTYNDQIALIDKNKKSFLSLRTKLLSIFPKDSDGDRWMLCK